MLSQKWVLAWGSTIVKLIYWARLHTAPGSQWESNMAVYFVLPSMIVLLPLVSQCPPGVPDVSEIDSTPLGTCT